MPRPLYCHVMTAFCGQWPQLLLSSLLPEPKPDDQVGAGAGAGARCAGFSQLVLGAGAAGFGIIAGFAAGFDALFFLADFFFADFFTAFFADFFFEDFLADFFFAVFFFEDFFDFLDFLADFFFAIIDFFSFLFFLPFFFFFDLAICSPPSSAEKICRRSSTPNAGALHRSFERFRGRSACRPVKKFDRMHDRERLSITVRTQTNLYHASDVACGDNIRPGR